MDINKIIEKYNIKIGTEDTSALCIELKKILVELHPDKNGGEFLNDEKKRKYLEINEALEYLDKNSEKSLININDITSIVKIVNEIIKPQADAIFEQHKNEIKKNIKLQIKVEIKTKYLGIRVGSTIFSTITGGLVIFPSVFKENPLISYYLKNEWFHIVLLSLLITSSVLFVLTWIMEQKDERKKEWLFSEEGKLELLEMMIEYSHLDEDEKFMYFSFKDFVNSINWQGDHVYLIEYYWKKHKYLDSVREVFRLLAIKFNSTQLSIGVIEELATYHLGDLLKRNIIDEIDKKSFHRHFKIDKNYFK